MNCAERLVRQFVSQAEVARQLKIDRDDFPALYAESLCILHQPSENQPDPDLCAQLLGD